MRFRFALLAAVSAALAVAPPVNADHPRQAPPAEAAQAPFGPEPPLQPTPRALCGPGSRPESGIQGRVSPADHESGRASEGFQCNAEKVGEYSHPSPVGTVGGFKVERFVDPMGHECAYYDTTLMYPTNLLDQEGGVNVLDMENPEEPELTARLTTPAMLTPHESLVLSQSRGLLVAVAGNLVTNIGQIDIYDISQDCRHPVLKSTSPVGFLGHESGLSPDGNTFYSASPSAQTLVAVDISNPSLPQPISFGNYDSHGLSISNDGNRAYVAGTDSGLIILDTSQVQARAPSPQMPEVARLQWQSMSIPQNAIPITVKGHPYLVEIDEFGTQQQVGAGRIIDIANETEPARGLEPPARGAPEGELPGAGQRQRREQPRSGLRRPLLQRADAGGPRDRRLHHDPVRPPCVRHTRPGASARDRLLQRSGEAAHRPARGHQPAAEQLGDGEPDVRARAQRDLVLRRPQRLLRRAAHERGDVRAAELGRPLPRAPLADRPAQHRPRADRLRARPAAAASGQAQAHHAPLLPLLRQAHPRPRRCRVLAAGAASRS